MSTARTTQGSKCLAGSALTFHLMAIRILPGFTPVKLSEPYSAQNVGIKMKPFSCSPRVDQAGRRRQTTGHGAGWWSRVHTGLRFIFIEIFRMLTGAKKGPTTGFQKGWTWLNKDLKNDFKGVEALCLTTYGRVFAMIIHRTRWKCNRLILAPIPSLTAFVCAWNPYGWLVSETFPKTGRSQSPKDIHYLFLPVKFLHTK